VPSEKSTKKIPESTAIRNSSSDCDETLCQNQETEDVEDFAFFDRWYSVSRLLLFNIEIEPINFYYSISEMNREITASDTLNQILGDEKTSSELFVLNLPNFSISSKWPEAQLAILTKKHFSIQIPTKEWSKGKVLISLENRR
jgi:hypothetical protein